MAATFKQGTNQTRPLLDIGPAFAAVANLPTASDYPMRIVALQASTAPNQTCLAISDGTSWYPILVGTTAIS